MIEMTNPRRILVVDDEPDNIWPLIKYLEADFEVLCATTGEQALDIALSGKKPDLILLDILLPGMDGYAVCSRLKAEKSTNHIPVIFLTARTDEIDEAKGLELGAQDYIIKPFSLPVVRARINSVLKLKKELERRQLLKSQLEQLNGQLESQVHNKMDELEKARQSLLHYEEKYHHLFREKPVAGDIKRILVVDDDPEEAHILHNHLREQYEIICEVNGETALERVRSDMPPDLILLDIIMPGMDGFEVCSRLKADAGTRDIPVIFITIKGQEVDETRGLNLGAVDFITKPFSIPIVEARIQSALRLKQKMDQRTTLTIRLEELNQDLETRVKEKSAALKRAHAELQASEKQYRNIYENAPVGIVQVSIEGQILSANPAVCRIIGYASPEELMAKLTDIRHQLYVHPEQRDDLLALLEERGAIFDQEVKFYKKDKQIVWVSISARSVRDDTGRTLFFEGFLTDISKRKFLEEQLRQAAKMEAIGKLVGGVAHDFNNLMTSVLGYSDLLLLDLPKDDPSRKPIELIKKSGVSAAALTRELLTFSRKHVVQPVAMDLNLTLAVTEKLLHRLIGEDIEIVVQPDPALGLILADPPQIEQVIMNLAVNARDAMPQGGKIIIATSRKVLDEAYCQQHIDVRPGPYAMLTVTDAGVGIDTETLERIFEPFFTTKAHGEGTGLGLATVYGIVKQNGGHIQVNSEVGKGSTFEVYFPISEKAAEQTEMATKNAQASPCTETIMVAEDDEDVRELAIAILKNQGYTVLAADSGQTCLRQLADYNGPLDLLLTDVVMPDLNGKALAQQAHEQYVELKVLYMSGYTDDVIDRHGVLEKGIHFIAKPFTFDALAKKVRTILDS